jgi:hypothetical protein
MIARTIDALWPVFWTDVLLLDVAEAYRSVENELRTLRGTICSCPALPRAKSV